MNDNNSTTTERRIIRLEMEGSKLEYDAPEPSLCDTCVNAGHVPGGSCGSFSLDGSEPSKDYLQRYCRADRKKEEGKIPQAPSIHAGGPSECDYYKRCNDNRILPVYVVRTTETIEQETGL